MAKLYLAVLILLLFRLTASPSNAHEMTPTYPVFEPAHLQGIYKTQVKIFNGRQDVEYYELGLFDTDFNVVDFVTAYRVFPVRYLGHVTLDIYVRKKDLKKVEYICTRSKLRSEQLKTAIIASRICSRVRQ